MVADIEIYQKIGTAKIYTQVTVRTVSWASSAQILSFDVNITYVNFTEFSIPAASGSFTAKASTPRNSLSGSVTGASFISGHMIAVSVRISNVKAGNVLAWGGHPAAYSEKITIR